MIFLAVLLVALSVIVWRVKAKAGFPLSKRLEIVQWLAFVLGVALGVASMAVVVPPGHADVVVLLGRCRTRRFPPGCT